MENRKKGAVVKAVFIGLLAGIALLSVYFVVVSLANSVEHAVQEFFRIWQWITALVAGFGIQVGLYAYIREAIKIRKLAGATTSITAAGGVSTSSMLACCAHHLTDVLPIIGISAASIFLNKYQESFLLTGVLSNLAGILIMLRIMQTNRLYNEQKGALRAIFKVNLRKVLYFAIPASLILIAISFIKTL
ncbi:hypothetical protein J4470_01675 [Candidatus Woesearchaeota archaeon]|nr:hypothetical protein [Candidatus Woesearchaeota archaeon]